MKKKYDKKQMRALFLILLAVFGYLVLTEGIGAEASLSNADFLRFHVVANSDSEADQDLKLEVRDGLMEKIETELAAEMMGYAEPAGDTGAVSLDEGAGTTGRSEAEEAGTGELAWSRTEEAKIPAFSLNQAGKTAAGASLPEMEETPETLTRELAEGFIILHMAELEEEANRILAEAGSTDQAKAELGVRWIPEKSYGNVTFPAGLYRALTVKIGEGKGQNWWCCLFPPLCLIDGTDSWCAAKEAEIYMQSMDPEKYKELLKESGPRKLELRFALGELLGNGRPVSEKEK